MRHTWVYTVLAMAVGLAACNALVPAAAPVAAGPAASAPATAPATRAAAVPNIGPGGKRVKLWDKTPAIANGQDSEGSPLEPTMDIYLPPAEKANGAAVVIFPGGGYTNVAIAGEGTPVAGVFVSHNLAAFVVRYRHAPLYHYPIPIEDAQRAIRTVRSKAAEFHIDPAKIGVIGFSAGGHLAASTATMYADGPAPETIGGPDAIDGQSAKPAFAMLMYPVINFTDDAVIHRGSRDSLTNRDPSLYAALSPEQHVTKETPPIFLVHGTDDRTVPVMNSILMYEACLKAQVPVELHIFENARHGFGLGGNDPQLKTWPDMAISWLAHNKFIPG